MMTYGWAILIIVIIAAILYSLGIFTPSRSVSTVSTGLAPFTINGQACTDNGFEISILLGGLPGLSGQATIINASIVSESGMNGTSIISSSPGAINSGYSKTLTFSSTCSTPGSTYNAEIRIWYSYNNGALGSTLSSSSGSVEGFAAASVSSNNLPANIKNYSQITIDNAQALSTPSPFQQMINVSSSVYSAYANLTGKYSFQNIEFFNTTSDTVIDSWLERYTPNYAIFWIKLPNGVPANKAITDVAMGFASKTTKIFNASNVGEAPTLSQTYAKYDNGQNVFYFYDNFNGTTLNGTKWSSSSYGTASYQLSNNLTLAESAAYSAIALFSKQTFSTPLIFNAIGFYYSSNGGIPPAGMAVSLTNTLPSSACGDNVPVNESYSLDQGGSTVYLTTQNSNCGGLNSYNQAAPSSPASIGVGWNATGHELAVISNTQEAISDSTNTFSPYYLSVWAASGGYLDTAIYQYVFAQAYPPNAVMPTATFGAVQ
jgi:hypothetical protein